MCSRVVAGILECEEYTGKAMVGVAWGYVACLDGIKVVCARGLWPDTDKSIQGVPSPCAKINVIEKYSNLQSRLGHAMDDNVWLDMIFVQSLCVLFFDTRRA